MLKPTVAAYSRSPQPTAPQPLLPTVAPLALPPVYTGSRIDNIFVPKLQQILKKQHFTVRYSRLTRRSYHPSLYNNPVAAAFRAHRPNQQHLQPHSGGESCKSSVSRYVSAVSCGGSIKARSIRPFASPSRYERPNPATFTAP